MVKSLVVMAVVVMALFSSAAAQATVQFDFVRCGAVRWCHLPCANETMFVKQAFGGSEVTKTREGKVVSVADDLKAASTDALKKAATLMGVALQLHGVDAPPQRVHAGPKLVEQPPEPDSPPNNRLTRKQAEFIGKLAKSNGMGRSELDELAKQHYGKSAAFLTVKEASEFISTLSTVAA